MSVTITRFLPFENLLYIASCPASTSGFAEVAWLVLLDAPPSPRVRVELAATVGFSKGVVSSGIMRVRTAGSDSEWMKIEQQNFENQQW